MKERLVEDWLTRINERGYEVPFSQALISTGHRVLRCGHSPTEHGKDILSVMPEGTVAAYQLKTGDFGQKEITNYLAQIRMLVEARPIFPGLIEPFDYRPFLVTTGEFKEPAVSLVKELNASWRSRNLHEPELIDGRELHIQFVLLAGDFWPMEAKRLLGGGASYQDRKTWLHFAHKLESGEVADDYLRWFTTIFSAVSKALDEPTE